MLEKLIRGALLILAVAQCNLLQDKAVDVEKRAQSQR